MVVQESANHKERSFKAVTDRDKDTRIPVLLGVISTIIALQRMQRVHPTRILLRADLYTAVGVYMGQCTVDKLFNVPVTANLSTDCMPFIIESNG